ncbi:MAG TPA: DUF6065 family protein [Phycisphaerales bacterium]|nr:DUF6065 family protein [Phycisphaerales bacterium]HMP36852.1 DUF6065 family protein [Phycisphaerales bacterium]
MSTTPATTSSTPTGCPVAHGTPQTLATGLPGELVAYRHSNDEGWALEPSSARREWMDNTTGRFAYRCLPLVMANQLGWIVRSPGTFAVKWTGKVGVDALTIRHTEGPENFRRSVLSHFGHGIVSFMLPWVFRTPPGVALLVRGATNFWVHNAHPLDGLVETDWISTTFTMNWQMIAMNREAWFRKGDPICMLTPLRVDVAESLAPRYADLSSNPRLQEEVATFNRKRGETARINREKFEKGEKDHQTFELDYMHGQTPSGAETEEHRTNIKLKRFAAPGGA